MIPPTDPASVWIALTALLMEEGNIAPSKAPKAIIQIDAETLAI
jgi:hypothetical protein